jgi:valyl-tRNA synthetase
VQLRLFAPVLPFVTEEVWSWWQAGSVHRAPWPAAAELPAGGDAEVLPAVAEVLSLIRKAKSDAKVSMRADADKVTVSAVAGRVAALEAGRSDLIDAGRIRSLSFETSGGEFRVDVVLAPPAQA